MLKKVALALAMLGVVSTAASAACPLGTRYQCHPTYNGKMQCGCY